MVDRVLAGKHPDTGVTGLWISKPGFDARLETNPDNFLFDPSKYMARAYARVSPGRFTRGTFVFTQTFSDGSKSDNFFWDCFIPLPFGYVPLIIAQVSNTLMNAATTDGVAFTASGIVLKLRASGAFRYLANDPNKTPIAGSMDPRYDPATLTLGLGETSLTSFIIYRNPLVGA